MLEYVSGQSSETLTHVGDLICVTREVLTLRKATKESLLPSLTKDVNNEQERGEMKASVILSSVGSSRLQLLLKTFETPHGYVPEKCT